jgi:hypothetical protein
MDDGTDGWKDSRKMDDGTDGWKASRRPLLEDFVGEGSISIRVRICAASISLINVDGSTRRASSRQRDPNWHPSIFK